MSVAARLVSGTIAAWVQIGINMITQLALVPLYLTYWKVETYGLWLAIMAFANVLNSLDLGFQDYVGFEFLKIEKDNALEMSEYLSSVALMGLLLGLLQLLIIGLCIYWGLIAKAMNDSSSEFNEHTIFQAGIVLILQGGAWLICGSIGGLLTRALSAYNYYSRMAWWGVFSSICMSLAPVIAVMYGAGILYTGITLAAARILADIPIYIDMVRLLRQEGVTLVKPSFKLGWRHLVCSSVVSVTNICENFRQQGIRLIITPLAGAVNVAAFTTMRTGANVAMQGLHTITNPLIPDLMRFIHKRDQMRINTSFNTVWLIVTAAMAPAVVAIQLLFEPLFQTWTRGKIAYNPWLFAYLSLTVLVYAISQPAIIVVRGNNLIKKQITAAICASVIVVLGLYVWIPLVGITGAGIALVLAELFCCAYYKHEACKWLAQHNISWPARSFSIAVTSVITASACMVGIILLPQSKWITLMLAVLLLGINFWRYWQALPLLATQHAKNIIGRLPGFKSLLSKKNQLA